MDCVYQQWFLEVFLSPFSNVNDIIMPMSDAVSSEDHGHPTKGVRPLSLTHRDFSIFSELITMFCTEDVEICKAL